MPPPPSKSEWIPSYTNLSLQEVPSLLLNYFFPAKQEKSQLYYPLETLIASTPTTRSPLIARVGHQFSLSGREVYYLPAPQTKKDDQERFPSFISARASYCTSIADSDEEAYFSADEDSEDCDDSLSMVLTRSMAFTRTLSSASSMASSRRLLEEATGLDYSGITLETSTPDPDLIIEIPSSSIPRKIAETPTEVQHRPFKRQRLLGSLRETMTLLVGPTDTAFTIHRDILCQSSLFFRTACKPVWKSRDDEIIHLPEDDPDAIEAMCYWMYYNEICVSDKIREQSDRYTKNPLETTQGLFVKLYLIGEKYFMPRLQNDAIDAILSYNRTIELVQLSTYIWENTTPNSKLRDLLVRLVGDRYRADDLAADKEYICSDFLLALALAAFKQRDKGYNRFRDQVSAQERFCEEFHVHAEGRLERCQEIKDYVMGVGDRAQ